MVLADSIALPVCICAAAFIVPLDGRRLSLWSWLLPLAVGLLSLELAGFYRSIVRFIGIEVVLAATKPVTLTAIALAVSLIRIGDWPFAARMAVAFWLVATVYVCGSRLIVRLVLRSKGLLGDRVVVYGAGDAGARLASSVAGRGDFTVVGFVDDAVNLQGAVINGLEVHSPNALPSLIEEFAVSRVLLALPSVSRRRRQEIIGRLEELPVHVQTMPDVSDLISGNARVDDIREVDIVDLLGRDTVPPIPQLLGACVTGKSVVVTGAGGSIGSELCRQIVHLNPRKLILFDISEPALYTIHQSIQEAVRLKEQEIEIVPLIGSVDNESRLREALLAYEADTVYHAAAYKHVPLVEHNMIEGIDNNVFGTLHAAEAAIAAGVRSFVLVSTDKAVLPTNVMGATKRLAELVLQSLNEHGSTTTFSMVRFGNVLASSGSVVPLFHEQIRNGGPVTVTHPEIYRYFMTIPEAAALVIQAGSMAKGGDVFVLDMGEPVRIRDLAETMIHLTGLTVKDKDHPEGDIEIRFTGLRPGEKLYEELLIGTNVMGTDHPSIMRAEEVFIRWAELKGQLDQLWHACQRFDCATARQILLQTVNGYAPTGDLQDLVWKRRPARAAEKEAVASVTELDARRLVPSAERPS